MMVDASVTATQPGVEGRLDLALRFEGGCIASARLTSSRPIGAVKMFQGKTVEQTLGLMPLMFSLCGRAQALASVVACEQALGIVVSNELRAVRDIFVLAEAMEQDALRMSLDWPLLFGDPPNLQPLQPLKKALANLTKAIDPDAACLKLHGGVSQWNLSEISELIDLIDQEMINGFGKPERIDTLTDLLDWAKNSNTPLAKAVLWASDPCRAAIGKSHVAVLGEPDLLAADTQLSNDTADKFMAQPHIKGGARETGPLDEVMSQPLMTAIIKTHGSGLMARFVARCLHLWQIPEKMRSIIGLKTENSLQQKSTGPHEAAAQTNKKAAGAGYITQAVLGQKVGGTETTEHNEDRAGIAAVQTARGWLVHRVALAADDNFIRDYRTVAPTEWNFSPTGPLIQGLEGLKADDWCDAEWKAGALVIALDPCVSFQISRSA